MIMTTTIGLFIGLSTLAAAETVPANHNAETIEEKTVYNLPEVVCTAERTLYPTDVYSYSTSESAIKTVRIPNVSTAPFLTSPLVMAALD